MGKAKHPTGDKREQTPAGRRQALLLRTVEIYEKALWGSNEALAFLEAKGLRDDPLLVRHRVGYSATRARLGDGLFLVDIRPGHGTVAGWGRAGGRGTATQEGSW